MFKILFKNKKGQNTAEYAILISLVVAGIIAMQTYAQRALQARVRDAGQYLATETSDIGSTVHYEPYYLETDYEVSRADTETVALDVNKQERNFDNNRTRAKDGAQVFTYNAAGLINGI